MYLLSLWCARVCWGCAWRGAGATCKQRQLRATCASVRAAGAAARRSETAAEADGARRTACHHTGVHAATHASTHMMTPALRPIQAATHLRQRRRTRVVGARSAAPGWRSVMSTRNAVDAAQPAPHPSPASH
jgi:hypothetical protein